MKIPQILTLIPDPVAGGEPQVAFAVFDDIMHLIVNQRPAVAR